MKKQLVIVSTVVCLLVFTALLSEAGEDAIPADPGKVWTHITECNPYLGWGTWPGYPGIYPGKSPHGAFLKLYANGIALKAAREGKPMPNGAIIVKENYGKDQKTLMAITPMYKVKGYNPDAADWFWAKYAPDGTVAKSGKVKGCIDCHRTQEEKDWLFTTPK
jgi:hypothetical protein